MSDPQPSPPPTPNDQPPQAGAFVRHARTVAGLTLLSRISGLLRDAVCSRAFGTSPVWSAFVTAFIIPNLFRRLFGEGALSAAFIPRYTTLLDAQSADPTNPSPTPNPSPSPNPNPNPHTNPDAADR
ncbi:MAG: lipid II flippase MurJ, partial [Phycisphaerales bacterium]